MAKNFADELREISSRDRVQEEFERVINGEVTHLLGGIVKLSQQTANCGGRQLCGYFDSFYWDGTDFFIRPAMSATGYQRHTLPGSYPRHGIPGKDKLIYFSKSEIAYIHREIVNRLLQKLSEMGFSNIYLRVDQIAQKKSDSLFAGKTGVTLYYLWLNISW